MQILVTDRPGIQSGITAPPPFIIISIHDPEKPPATIPRNPSLREILTLSFHDAAPAANLPPGTQPMTPGHAAAIRDFVRRHQSHVAAIVVHCEGGFCRSPAVAAAVSEALGLDPRRFWQDYKPLTYVYDMVMDAFESVQVSRQEPDGGGR